MSGAVHVERDGDVAILVIDNPPVNAGSRAVRAALLAAVERVDADPGIRAAVLIGAGRSFVAGSDLKEFDLPLDPPQLPAVIAAIEASPKPFLAALDGAALGGGYELALGCDARIAAPGTVVGLPEASLGMIPGAGGTQKLPRLTGVAKAIELVCSGRRVGTREALELGMIDAVEKGALRPAAIERARRLSGKNRVIDRPLRAEDEEAIAAAGRKATAAGRGRPHILAAVEHVEAARKLPAPEALAGERAAFEALRVAPDARALRHVFFCEREAARGRPGRAAAPLPVERLGVVGAGTMGAGIATVMLQAGYRVVLAEADAAALSAGHERIEAALERAVSLGKLGAEARRAALERLVASRELSALAPCDLIVEAVTESLAVKQAVFSALDRVAKPGAVLATNTSYLDIDRIAAATGRPEAVIGLHFFAPAPIMKLVEVVGASRSADAALATGLALAKSLGKQPVEAGNGFGFIGNRIYAAYRASCEFMLEDGALPHEVDAALEAFGFAMGPFAVADLSGLDIAWRMRQQQAGRRDPRDRSVEIADLLCEMGRFGRKTGAGYYRYDAGAGRGERAPEVEALIEAESARKGIARRPLSPEDIRARALAAIVNEAALVLSEGIALRAGDIDVVLVNGYGFPRWKGGPVYWARQQDPGLLAADCAAFVALAGPGRRLGDPAALGVAAGRKGTGN